MTAVSKHYAVLGAKEILQQHHSKFHHLGVHSCQNVCFFHNISTPKKYKEDFIARVGQMSEPVGCQCE